MDYNLLKKSLENYPSVEVGVFVNYVKELETAKDRDGKSVNTWFSYVKYEQLIDLFKKVALDELYIDGETITISFRGKLIVTYNYQAYKNKLLKVYPETLFDIQNVCEGDIFNFSKENGKVVYSHKMRNPFENNKKIIGCYCVIKNKRGEFLETLNFEELMKLRNTAKTSKIWDLWLSEMSLKSVLKRSCKRHFNDVTTNIETLDNENYEPETALIELSVKELINNCNSIDELQDIYQTYKGKTEDEVVFLKLLSDRKLEIKKQS